MRTRTEYSPATSHIQLDPHHGAVLMGSCFTDHIGARMLDAMWRVTVNPCGTVFNPAVIATLITLALSDEEERVHRISQSIFQRDDIWQSWLMGSEMAALSWEECAGKCHEALNTLRRHLLYPQTQAIILTLGSAHVYELNTLNPDGVPLADPFAPSDWQGVVGNCHKVPSRHFHKRRLTLEEITETLAGAISKLKRHNERIKVILTLSPVRYLSDGFAENALSKATLLMACHLLTASAGKEAQESDDWKSDVVYFPAYEIVTDDLRDYRWYAEDMVHVTSQTADYVWEKFCETYLSEEHRSLLKEGRNITAAIRHRSLVAGSAADLRHREATYQKMTKFCQQHIGMSPSKGD